MLWLYFSPLVLCDMTDVRAFINSTTGAKERPLGHGWCEHAVAMAMVVVVVMVVEETPKESWNLGEGHGGPSAFPPCLEIPFTSGTRRFWISFLCWDVRSLCKKPHRQRLRSSLPLLGQNGLRVIPREQWFSQLCPYVRIIWHLLKPPVLRLHRTTEYKSLGWTPGGTPQVTVACSWGWEVELAMENPFHSQNRVT